MQSQYAREIESKFNERVMRFSKSHAATLTSNRFGSASSPASRIAQSLEDGTFAQNKRLLSTLEHAKTSSGRLHLIGLVSDGGVHSHITHLFALLQAAKHAQVPQCYIHVITDGRDTKPQSAIEYVAQLQAELKRLQYGTIATVQGRYYAMDRDKRWERVQKAYDAMVDGKGAETTTSAELIAAMQKRYAQGENDEFLKPFVLELQGTIRDKDTMLFFNYRSDRMREIVMAFLPDSKPFDAEVTVRSGLHIVQMTQYDPSLSMPTLFPPQTMKNALAEWLSVQGCAQFHTAETEKYAHVTFFFAGGVEVKFPREERAMVQSPKVATYDLAPEMNMSGVASSVIEAVQSNKYEFILCNLAAPDMVGHTGKYEAAVRACTACDIEIGRMRDACAAAGYSLIVTADHGNAEEMVDEKGEPKTSHTTNYIPLLVQTKDATVKFTDAVQKKIAAKQPPCGGLADVAPTVLTLMGLPVPQEMTGVSLLQRA